MHGASDAGVLPQQVLARLDAVEIELAATGGEAPNQGIPAQQTDVAKLERRRLAIANLHQRPDDRAILADGELGSMLLPVPVFVMFTTGDDVKKLQRQRPLR